MGVMVATQDILDKNLWKLFPAINVDKVKDIPKDYIGVMGVPITYLDKHNAKQFEIVGILKPKIGKRELYRRILIRNLHPDLPKFIDLEDMLKKCGAEWEIEILHEKVSSDGNA